MKKRVSIPVTIIIALICTVITFQITYVFCLSRGMMTGQKETAYNREKLAFVDQLYQQNFVGQMDEEELTDMLIRGYLAGSGDKYASYLTADECDAYINNLEGNLVGVGVTVVYNADYDLIEVISVVADTPAEQAGLLPGDLIYAVDGKSAAEMGYYGTVAAVRGDVGSEVTMTVLRGDGYETTKEFSMTRTQITEITVNARMYADSDIGIVRINEFNTATVEQFNEAIDFLMNEGAKKLLFDLRYNPGGELGSITAILDKILPEGDIIKVTDKAGNQSTIAVSDANEIDLPMAVLINGSSASAAELFAASIRDYQKGLLIGETTFGKGTMQTLMPLPDGSAISISYRMFTSAAGVNYEGIGIEPDITVPLDETLKDKNFYKITDEEDNQLQAALQYLRDQ
ncbi:MAG: S41 family peptidase [Clostridiales bacterium]|nr:S41 family peptidase [Clostridiales bacterium]